MLLKNLQNKGFEMSKDILKKILMAVLLLAALLSITAGVKNALYYSQDFQWDAAKALMMHMDPYDVSLSKHAIVTAPEMAEFNEYFESINAPQKMEANQFPSLLFLLSPFTLLHYTTARAVWLVLNLLFTAAIIFLLRKTFMKQLERDTFIIVSLLMIAGTPWRNQIGVGQHTLFSFAAFLLAVWLSERGNAGLSAISLAVSYFKYTLTAPLALWFIYKRRFKEFAISVFIHIAMTIFSCYWLGESFIDMIIKPLKVSSALAGEGSLDISAVTGGASWSLVLTGVLMIALLIIAWKMKEGFDNELFTLLLLVSLIITYHRSYDYFVLAAALPGIINFKKLRIFYAFTVLFIFFGLRVFHENTPSLIAAGICYYALLIIYTVIFMTNSNSVSARS